MIHSEASIAPLVFDVSTLGTHTRVWSYGAPEARPLIMVHGFRGDHHGLEPLAARIAATLPGTRVLVPDLPGFGESPAVPGRTHDIALHGEWLCELTERVAEGGHDILGHSFGSLVVGAALSQGLPSDLITLVNPISAPALEGPRAILTQLAIGYYRLAGALPPRAAHMLLAHPAIVRGMSITMAKTRDPQLRTWIHDQHDRYFSTFSDPNTLLQAFRASVSHTVPEFLAGEERPTLLIAGDRDDITPLPAQLALRNRLTHARLRVVPGVGHLIHYEAIDDAAAEIAHFLSTARGEGGKR